MYVKAITAALAIAVAGPAFANSNLAASLGVEPGVFSTTQLAALKAAQDSDDFTIANYIIDQGGAGEVIATRGADSTVPLFTIEHAREADEYAIANGLERKNNGELNSVTELGAGHTALANSLGLDASEYTVSELIRIKNDREGESSDS